MELRYTQLATYIECSYKYYKRYVEGKGDELHTIPVDTGSLFHIGIQAHNKGCDGAMAIKEASLVMLSSSADSDREEEIGIATWRAQNALRAYLGFLEAHPLNVVATEVNVTRDVVRGPYRATLSGTIDSLAIYNDELWMVEYKTGNPDLEYYALWSWQAPFYAWLTGARGTIFELLNTSTKNVKIQRHEMEWTALEQRFIIQQLMGRVADIEAEDFRMRSQRACSWCEFKGECLARIQRG